MPVPNSFANVTTSIPLSQLDANFNTPITIGNTAVQLGNTVTTLNNMTLANVTISSGSVTITNVSATTANVTTANVTNLISGNVALTGGSINGTTLGASNAATANVTTLTATNLTLSNSAVISVNTAGDALRITQTGAGNALVVEDDTNPDSSPFVVNTDGIVIQGTTAYDSNWFSSGNVPKVFQIANPASSNREGFASISYSGAPGFSMFRATGGVIGTEGAVANGDITGQITFAGYDGTTAGAIPTALIRSDVDGTPGVGDMPGRLLFLTTADGASTATERMRIDSAGQVAIGSSTSTAQSFRVAKAITGSTTAYSIVNQAAVQSGVTSSATMFYSGAATQAASFTLSSLNHYSADQNTFGASSTVTNQYGFVANSSLTGATNNYGFYSNIASGTGRWNFYANGTASNFFGGDIYLGSTNGYTTSGITSPLLNASVTSAGEGIGLAGWVGVSAGAPNFQFLKSRGSAPGTYTVVVDGDSLGILRFSGADGTNFISAATITGAVDGTPGTNDMPGRLVFSTTADGASSPTERMRIDNAGQVGIGGTPSASTLHLLKNVTGGTTAFGISNAGQIQSDVTGTARYFNSAAATQDASFTLTNLQHYAAFQSTFGASSTVTNQYGFTVGANLTGATNNYGFYGDIASGTGRWNLYMNGTAENYLGGNLKIGGTAARATTAGTNQLVLFNGTAPVGTLANGVSFYSASGEARVMDAAGNSTLLSPHDSVSNEWIFHSKHTPTGKVLRIDVEKMLRFINDHFGLDMVHEFTEGE